MIAWLAIGAWASDLAVTSVGAAAVRAEAIDDGDVDLLLGQRVRWGIAVDTQFLADARFTVDPDGPTTLEQSRVRSLGVAYDGSGSRILAGRHPLVHGGPRLVDGAQALLHPGALTPLDVGGWVGLAADPFTTKPLLRPGFGPVVAWNGSALGASALGEVLFGEGGLDRVGGLLQARASWAPTLSVSARTDWLVADGEGRSGLADGAASVRVTPVPALKLDASYNAFSSLRYQTTAALDPTVQRFEQRVAELDLQDFILEDTVDPTLQHVGAASVRLRPKTDDIAPLAGVMGRARAHPVPEQQMFRVGPHVGVAGLAGGRLEVIADLYWVWAEGRAETDTGLNAIFDLLPDGAAMADGSVRMLLDPVGYEGRPGWYTDLFIDAVANSGTLVAIGGSWTSEPSDVVVDDVGWAAFLRVQQWIRPGRSTPRAVLEPVADAEEP